MGLFSMYQNTPVGGDYTCGYRVRLERQCTVKELIEEIMRVRPNEWGNIRVIKPKTFNTDAYGKSISFQNGKCDTVDISDMLDENVKNVSATGGWTRMDWYINI